MKTMLLLTGLLACSFAAQAAHPPKPEPANFTTADGVEIVGDYYAPEGRAMAPAVVLLHQYRADRTSWKPLIPKLHEAGFAVLAIDLRGFGGSTKPDSMNLAKRATDRDPSLFADMHQDVAAAYQWLSKQPNVDLSMFGMVGASVGCSVALDYAVGDKSVDAIVCLSPGMAYMGLDSAVHIKAVDKRPMLLMATEGERNDADALAEINASAEVRIAGEGTVHGTHMLDKMGGIDEQIVAFLSRHVRGSPGKPVVTSMNGHTYFAIGSEEDIRLEAQDRRILSSVEEARARGLDGPDSAFEGKLVDPPEPKNDLELPKGKP